MIREARHAAAPGGVGMAVAFAVFSLLAALGAVLFVLVGLFGVVTTATPNMHEVDSGATVTVAAGGLSVYAHSDERLTTVCRATADEGGAQVVLQRPEREYVVTSADTDFYEVARAPKDFSRGSYVLTCDGPDTALFVGPEAPATSPWGVAGLTGVIAGVLLAFMAIVLGVVATLLWLGRRGARGVAARRGPAQALPPGRSRP